MALKHQTCVEVSFGSEIQRDVSLRVLQEYLEVFRTSVDWAQRRNEVIISEREPEDAEQFGLDRRIQKRETRSAWRGTSAIREAGINRVR